MAVATQPLFALTDYQSYTQDESTFNFSMTYDMAWSMLVEYCPSLAYIDEDDANLAWLKKALMIQINWLNTNEEVFNSVLTTTQVSIGDYSESYTFNRGGSSNAPYIPTQVLNLLSTYFGCSPWLTRTKKWPFT